MAQLDEILGDFSSLGRTLYLDDPMLGIGHAALELDDIGIPEFSPDLPRLPLVLVERNQAVWTHPADGPRQEVWTAHSLMRGMHQISFGVYRFRRLDGWAIGEWHHDGGGLQLQQPDGDLFVYALCELDEAWIAAANQHQWVVVLHGPVLGVRVPPGQQDTYSDELRCAELLRARRDGLVTGGLVRWGHVETW